MVWATGTHLQAAMCMLLYTQIELDLGHIGMRMKGRKSLGGSDGRSRSWPNMAKWGFGEGLGTRTNDVWLGIFGKAGGGTILGDGFLGWFSSRSSPLSPYLAHHGKTYRRA